MRLLGVVGDHLDPRIALTIYGRPELFEAYPDVANRFATEAMPAVGSKAARIGLEQTWLAAKTSGQDAVHHAGGTVPFVRRSPAILTVHDPQPLDMPENFHPVKRRWLQWALPYSVRAADLVICPSGFTADRLVELLGVPRRKLRVVLHGHDPVAGLASFDGAVDDPIERFGRYLLYPAIAYPHKRHVDAVRMLPLLDPEFDDVGLVLTGRSGPLLDEVMAEASRLQVAHRVHAVGRVPVERLELLYRSAEALVFPSAYEGFGNPALEAMNLRCPAIVSDAGALPEVVGDAGLIFPVTDVQAMAGAVTKVLADGGFADDLRARGVARAGSFSVGIAARQLAEVYGELAEI